MLSLKKNICGYLLLFVLLFLFGTGVSSSAFAATPTTTALTASSASVPLNTVITLTATVTAGGPAVYPGQVVFCEASSAANCTGVAILGTTELISPGTVTWKFVPGMGAHTYIAVFKGTTTYATSASSTVETAVAGPVLTATTIAKTGGPPPAPYTLTATTVGASPSNFGNFTTYPTGTVSFLDTSNGNASLGDITLGTSTLSPKFVKATGSPFPTGSYAESVAVGDFNGDGIPDLVVTYYNSNALHVFLGNGSGGFTESSGSPVTVGNLTWGVVVGDFNGDGKLDFAVTGQNNANLRIFLGNGSGGFTQASGSPISVGTTPYNVVAGDFNGDGILDLAVANYGSNTVSIFLGNGNGGFAPAPSITGLSAPIGMAIGDFNGDGIPDLAVVNSVASGTVSIFLGDGSGGFTPSGSPITVGANPYDIAVGDFNGDGIHDLAVTSVTASSGITILLGNGSGGFTSAAPIATTYGAHKIATSDFNGDGILDLAVTDINNTIGIFLGNGSGGFTPAPGSPYVVGFNPYGIGVSDFNGDGAPDLVVIDTNFSNAANILLNQVVQTAVLSGVTVVGTGTHNADASYSGDMNYVSSLSTTVPLQAVQLQPTIALTANPSSGITGQPVTLTASLSIPTPVTVPSTDGETVTFKNGATVLGTGTLSNGVATLTLPAGLPADTNSLTVVYPGDTNLLTATSPNLAYAVATPTTSTLAVSSTSVSLNTVITLTATVTSGGPAAYPGQVLFCEAASAANCVAGNQSVLGSVELTSAGTAIWKYIPGLGAHTYIAVFVGTPNGTPIYAASTTNTVATTVTGLLPTTTTVAATGANPYTLTATVVGYSDILVGPTGTVSFFDTTNSNYLLGTGSLGASTLAQTLASSSGSPFTVGSVPRYVAVGDFNGDGILDMAVTNSGGNTVNVFLGDGTGNFTPGSSITVVNSPYEIVAGDFNGDGKLDLAVVSSSTNAVSILLGNGSGGFAVSTVTVAGTGGAGIVAGDFNGDGKLDLATTSLNTNTVNILLGNGSGGFTLSTVAVSSPWNIVAGDFNGDGVLDLATTSYNTGPVNILLGNGHGGFTLGTALTGGVKSYAIAVADFNSDGKLDLAVTDQASGNVSVFLGDGSGGFTATAGSPITGMGGNDFGVAVGDFNHDGKLDMAVTSLTSNKVTILLGNGSGGFTLSYSTGAGSAPAGLAVADFNGDGLPDIATADFGGNNATVLLNTVTQTAKATLSGVTILGNVSHLIDASYTGDSVYLPSTSTTISLAAKKLPTTVTLTTSPTSTSTFGQSVTLTATLAYTLPLAPYSDQPNPNGESITFYSNGVSIGTGTLNNGVATLTLSSLAVGTDNLTASYAGDADLLTSTSSIVPINISKAPLTVTINTAVRPYGTANPTFTYTISGFLNGDTISAVSGAPVLTTSATTSSPLGSYPITGTVGTLSASNYSFTIISGVLIVNNASCNGNNFGLVNVGSSLKCTVSVPAPAAGTANTPTVMYLGATLKDFVDAGTGSCTTNGTSHVYSASDTCTVDVIFTPKYPGERLGAVQLANTAGTTTSTVDIYGTGVSPLVTFPSNTTVNTLASGFNGPFSVAVDGSGNIFVADYSNNAVKEIVAVGGSIPASPTILTLGSGFSTPVGVAVDGSGNVFVTDHGHSAVKEIVAVNGSIPASPTILTLGSGFITPYGVAVDGSGNVFVADYGHNAVKEIVAVNGSIPASPTILTLSSGFNQPEGVAVDGSGNVFVADHGNNAVKEIVAVGGSIPASPMILTLGSGFSNTTGVAVDVAGNVFVADHGNKAVKEIVAVGGSIPASPTILTLGSGFNNPYGVALDGSGNVFVADYGANAVKELDLIDPPTLSFAATVVGSTSTDSPQTVLVANSGNANLILPTPGSGTNPSISTNLVSSSFSFDGSTTCPQVSSSPGTLTLGSNCSLAVSFIPTVVGPIIGQVVLTDNNLNAAAPYATQTIPLNGVGLIIPTTTTLVSSLNPSMYGQPVTFTATVSPSAATGTITFSDGATVLCSAVATSSGVATCITSALAVGTHPITAVYSGDTTHSSSTSAALSQIVTPAVLTVTANDAIVVFGSAIPTPTYILSGFVNEDTQSVVSGTPTLATTATTSSPVGSYPITVTAGSLTPLTNYTFTFVNGTLTIIPATGANSSTTLTVSPSTVMYGDTSTLTAVVSPAGAGGTVTFTATPVGGGAAIQLGTSSAANNGTAVWPESTLDVGVYNIVATYNGDPNIGGSTSNTVQLTVTPRTAPGGGPALLVTVNDASRTTTQTNPSFSYTVSGTLVNNDTYATAVTGTPSYTTATGNQPGTFAITVAGLTSTNYTLTFVPGTLTVVSTATTTTLTATPSTSQYGDSITLTATVSATDATGTVSFYDGNIYLGQGDVSAGVATLVTTTLHAGTHTITAIYDGDSTYASDTSNPATVTVLQKTAPGGGAALTVTVQDASREYGAADPQFVYVVSGTLLNNDTYADAVTGVPAYTTTDTPTSPAGATFPIPVSGLVSQDYLVNYVSGTLMIVPDPTTTALTTNANTVMYGDTATLTASVSPSVATGTVSFVNGSNVLGQATISGGVATLTTTSLSAGTYVITAVYQGDGNYTSSTSDPVTVTVTQRTAPGGGAALTVTIDNESRLYGEGNPAFSYTVTGTLVGSDTYASAVTGVPVYATTADVLSPVGSYPITVSGLNSTNYVIAFVPGTLTVTQDTSTVTVSSSLNPSTYGQSVTFTATVPADATGTVTFTDGAAVLCSAVAISGTTATCTTSTLIAGTHPITASYSGDTNFDAATSTVLNQVVNKAPTTTTITNVSPSTITSGATETITVNVGPAGVAGSVAYYSNGVLIPGCISVPLVNGVATCSTTSLAVGTDQITATYQGNSNYAQSNATAVPVVVNPAITADFTVALSSTKYVAPGASVSYSVQVTSVNGAFNNPVNLTLTVNGVPLAQAISGATYTLTPSAVTPGANGASSTLTITVPQTSASNKPASDLGSKAPFALAILLLPLAAFRKTRGKLLLCVVVMLSVAGAVTGCGAGGYFAQPQKSYTIMITGTSGTLNHNSNTAQMIVE